MPIRTILADPPWRYGDKLRQGATKRSAEDQYDTMTINELRRIGHGGGYAVCPACDGLGAVLDASGTTWYACPRHREPKPRKRFLSLGPWSAEVDDPAFLFLWVTNPFLLDGSGVAVARAWGFEPKQLVTWVKTKVGWNLEADALTEGGELDELCGYTTPAVACADLNQRGLQFGMGHITRGVTEQMIIATRGKYSKLVKARNVRNVIFAPRTKHSAKPDAQYDFVERLAPGPYLEVFARGRRKGWQQWGNELESWS